MLYDLLFLLLFLGLLPMWLAALLLRPNLRSAVLARLRSPGLGPPLDRSVWLHGSSAGEVDLLRPLVATIEREHPGVPIVVSAFAISGYAAALKAFSRHRVVFLPPEFSPLIRRALKRFRPRLLLLVESELWPNLILSAAGRGVPVCLLNAKMSEKSYRLHRRLGLVSPALCKLTLVAAQTDEHAARFRGLGVPDSAIHVTGNMKYDLASADDPAALRTALRHRYRIDDATAVIIGGSLHAGEDAALAWAAGSLAADGHRFRLVIVPRYPAEAERMRAALANCGIDSVRKSALDDGSARLPADAALVVDSMGELKQFYAMSDIAFVGGSLLYRGSNKGGHNLMEPGILGVAVLFGPHNFSFKETVHDLLEDSAGIMVRDREELYRALGSLLAEPGSARALGDRARQLILARRGATDRNHALIAGSIDQPFARRERLRRSA
ncbi:MAG: 3-deoxy-D-manno-octulosonic acid transferase [Gammaproteobacteria bacterium]|nr:3-deoxy-D-manno-octulosonic acid transferase [Gammaproteobacteria bacterium]MDH4254631.1 3-deoxy-D-manno-octulosonic acid transferase [Gammaproteobacteria bacterium]MDH5309459.1 3-deoxy-D-manno-octulosonic acid transferase [Gammaproteobacteria bacterium]